MIKLISVNIEGDKHLPAVEKLIERERPDVVCLQEVFETDFDHLTRKFRLRGKLVPTVWIDEGGAPRFLKRGVFGNAILSHLPGRFAGQYYFQRRRQKLPNYQGYPNAGHRVLVWHTANNNLTIATTHFTWSRGGQVTQRQRQEMRSLLKLIDKLKPDILCGDFNTARGGKLWAQLLEQFTDNLPPEVDSTLDPTLHYAKGCKIVVDGFFTAPTSQIKVKSLRLAGGISDHLAIVATCQHEATGAGRFDLGDRG